MDNYAMEEEPESMEEEPESMDEDIVEEEPLPLECRPHEEGWINNPVIMDASNALFASESGYTLVSYIAPAVFCNHEDCAAKHEMILVTYCLWSPVKRIVCEQRVEAWNKDGRFRDSRALVRGYMILFIGLKLGTPFREVFRLYAKSLVWPSYELFIGPMKYEETASAWMEGFE